MKVPSDINRSIVVCGSCTLAVIVAATLWWKRRQHRSETEADSATKPPTTAEQFLQACKDGDIETAKRLGLMYRSLHRCVDVHGRNALHMAAINGVVEVLNPFLKAMMEKELLHFASQASNDEGFTPLHVACGTGQTEFVEKLLTIEGLDINVKDKNARTPVLIAACNGHIATVKLLLDHQANITDSDKLAKNPLHYAAHNNHEGIVKLLLEAAKDQASPVMSSLSGGDISGFTPLHSACYAKSLESVALLLQYGLPINREAGDGSTPLLLVAQNKDEKSISIAKMLLFQKDVNVHAQDRFGRALAHVACSSNNIEILRLCQTMLSAEDFKELFFKRDDDGMYPLHSLMSQARQQRKVKKSSNKKEGEQGEEYEEEREDVVQVEQRIADVCAILDMMTDAGFDVNSADYGDCTALHYLCAARPNTLSLVLCKKLLSLGADVSVLSCQEWTPLHLLHNNQLELNDLANKYDPNCGLSEAGVFNSLAVADQLREVVDAAVVQCALSTQEKSRRFDLGRPRKSANRSYLQLRGPHNRLPLSTRQRILEGDYTLKGIAAYLNRVNQLSPLTDPESPPKGEESKEGEEEGNANLPSKRKPRVVVLAGAGMSVSAGIPDFRSPNSGLYTNEKYRQMFSYETLMDSPKEFYALVKELFYPVQSGEVQPTKAHKLVSALDKKGWLQRIYTQNIDGLDRKAGISPDKIVETHGSLATARCTNSACQEEQDPEQFWFAIQHDIVPHCKKCSALVRPNCVFFGEPLPDGFFQNRSNDMTSADLLIVIGTSLMVFPVAGLVNDVGALKPRLLINRNATGVFQNAPAEGPLASFANDTDAGDDASIFAATANVKKNNNVAESSSYRDVAYLGECDDGCEALAAALGWEL